MSSGFKAESSRGLVVEFSKEDAEKALGILKVMGLHWNRIISGLSVVRIQMPLSNWYAVDVAARIETMFRNKNIECKVRF